MQSDSPLGRAYPKPVRRESDEGLTTNRIRAMANGIERTVLRLSRSYIYGILQELGRWRFT